MGDLGSLNVNITASAHQANTAIDELIKHLTKLNGALNNFRADSSYMKGLNNLVTGLRELRINLNGLDPKKTQDMAKAMESLAKAGENLAKINGVGSFTSSVEKDGNKLFAFSDKAKKEADEIAKKFKFDDKNGVNELAQAIEKLYASVGDDDEVRRSMQDIDALIETYSRYENELHQVAAARNEAIRSTHGKLNSDWQEALGGDYESARRNRAKVGIRNTSKSGANAGTIIGENTNLTGIQESANESENLAMALEILERNAYDAEHALVGFHEVSELVSGGMEAIRSVADGLVTSLGLDAEKFREVSAAAASVDNSVDDFMDIDIPDEEFTTFGQAAANAAPSVQQVGQAATSAAQPVEQMANAEQKAAAAGAEIQQVGNPFAGIVEGMRSLNDIHPSDSLRNLEYIRTTVSKIGGDMGAAAGASLGQIANGLKAFEGVNIPDYGDKMPTLAKGLRSLGSGDVARAAQSLSPVAQGLRELNSIEITADVERIAQLAYSVSRFGLANIEKATANIPPLATALRDLIATLAGAPAVSDNTIRMVEAMSRLNVHSANSATGMNRLSNGLRRYTGSAKKARSATKGLASAIGKIYATYWLLFRVISKIGKSISLASQLKEIQNVVDVTFGDMNDKMNEFAKNAVDTLGMSELTAKQVGSKFQAMGSNMGISKDMVKSTNDFVQKATQGYADVANSMADVSINLTRLAGDMASFYNQDYEEVAEKLQAVFTGQTRPLRAYGLDLTQATLKEWALKNGLDADIKSMTQAEKTLLRYQYVLANTTAAHGDFERTISTWANQIRIAKERLKQLGIVLGQIAIYTFKPLVQSFNKAMKRIIELATATLNSLGKIFGWQIEWTDGGVLRDEEEAAGDIADDMGEAADNAKKFKNFLLGIDELNLLPSDDDKDKGGKGLGDIGAGLGDLEGGIKIKPIEKGFESVYDTLYKLGKRIAEVMKDFLKNIDWDAVYKKARRFGKGLAQFLNGYLADAEFFYEKGRFIANGINTIANAIDAFFKEFDGWQYGVDIGSYINGFTENLDWNVIRSAAYEMAHDFAQTINAAFTTIKWDMVGKTIANGLNTIVDFFYTLGDEINWSVVGNSIATGINGVFSNFDFAKLGQGISKWAKGLLDIIIAFLDKVDWDAVGDSVGTFISNIDFVGIFKKVGLVVWKAFSAALKSYAGAFNAAPLQTAIVTLFASKRFRTLLLGKLSGLLSVVGKDISKLFSKEIGTTFLEGYFSHFAEGGSTSIGALANGFNSISASLSAATKAVGGFVVVAGEFALIKDAVFDIAKGSDDAEKSIAQLAITAGVASVALSAIFGVPAGLLIMGATAATAAIIGVNEAMEELREQNAIAGITKDMEDAYYTLGDLVEKYTDITEDITGGLDKLNGEYEKVEDLSHELNDIASGYSLVVSAIDGGNILTSKAMEELIGNIQDVKSAWEDYINAQYSYLIQSAKNDYQFAKSQGILTDEMEQTYIDRIASLTSAREEELSELNRLIEDLDKANGYYNTIVEQGAAGSALEYAEKGVRNAAKAILDFGSVTGAVTSGELKEFEDGLTELSNMKIDFSNIDATDYDTLLAEANGYLTKLNEQYEKSKNDIETDIASRMKADPSLTEEQARKDAQMYYDALNKATKDTLDNLQLSLFDVLVANMGTSHQDYLEAHDMSENIIKPMMDNITKTYEEVANGEKPKLESITFNLFKDTWAKGGFFDGGPVFSKNWKEVADEYRKQLEPISDDSKKITDSANKSLEKLGDGAKAGGNNLKNIAYAISDVNSISSVAKSGVVDLSDAFSRMSDSGKGIEQASTGMKSMNEGVRQFSSQLPSTQSNFKMLSTSMQTDVMGIDVAFKKMYTDTMVNGNKTIAWFKGSFIPLFSTAYWQNILSGIPIAFQNAFTMAFNNVKQMWGQFTQWANENMKLDVTAQKKGNAGTEVKMQFPAYEKGGFPEDGMFFANHTEMVGQFANGRTAVANNEQITDGIERAVYRAMSDVMSNAGGQSVNVELRGDAADFFTAMVNENNKAIMRTGASPIRV